MSKPFEQLQKQAAGRNFESPPLDKWHPPLSGDIDIRIDAQGEWYHEGSRFERQSIVRLFSRILRREDDGEYYLVTPGEKWRIQVELHALVVIDIEWQDEAGEPVLLARLNNDAEVIVDAQHRLFKEPKVGGVAVLSLDHGLSALFSRAAWYRLVDMASNEDDRASIRSSGQQFDL